MKISKFFGEISYPLYITHYPLIYWYYSWVARTKAPPARGAMVGAALFVTAVSVAYASLKLYDLPVRAWLTRRFVARTT